MKIVQNFHTQREKLIFFVPDVCTSIPTYILRLWVLKYCLKQKCWFSDTWHTFCATKLWALKNCSFPLGSSIWFWKKKNLKNLKILKCAWWMSIKFNFSQSLHYFWDLAQPIDVLSPSRTLQILSSKSSVKKISNPVVKPHVFFQPQKSTTLQISGGIVQKLDIWMMYHYCGMF